MDLSHLTHLSIAAPRWAGAEKSSPGGKPQKLDRCLFNFSASVTWNSKEGSDDTGLHFPIPELFVNCECSTKLVLPRLCTVRSLKEIEVQWQNLDQLYTLQLLCVRSKIYSEEATKIRLFNSNNGNTIPEDKAIKLIMSTGIVMLQVVWTRKDCWWLCKPISI